MLIEEENKELHRCVKVFLQWSFTLKSESESFFSATADAALPSFDDGETYQELAVKSWVNYFDSGEMLNIKKQIEGGII